MPSDEQWFTQFLGRAKNGDQAALSLLLRKQDTALNSYINKRILFAVSPLTAILSAPTIT